MPALASSTALRTQVRGWWQFKLDNLAKLCHKPIKNVQCSICGSDCHRVLQRLSGQALHRSVARQLP